MDLQSQTQTEDTAHPYPSISGMTVFPERPKVRKKRSVTNIARDRYPQSSSARIRRKKMTVCGKNATAAARASYIPSIRYRTVKSDTPRRVSANSANSPHRDSVEYKMRSIAFPILPNERKKTTERTAKKKGIPKMGWQRKMSADFSGNGEIFFAICVDRFIFFIGESCLFW